LRSKQLGQTGITQNNPPQGFEQSAQLPTATLPCRKSSSPGRCGWLGGLGTASYSDPQQNLAGILLTQRMFEISCAAAFNDGLLESGVPGDLGLNGVQTGD
jgi:CubicO group peptidase (beta-lactamase class C family)